MAREKTFEKYAAFIQVLSCTLPTTSNEVLEPGLSSGTDITLFT